MKHNPGLITIDDHRVMGAKIKRVRAVFIDLFHCLDHGYGVSHRIPRMAYRIDGNFSVLKSLLENAMLRHCAKSLVMDWTEIYYGGTPEQPRLLGDAYPRKLAIEHHQILNGALTDIQDTIDTIALCIAPAYGATSQVGKAAQRLCSNLLKLRTALRDEAARTYGDVGTAIYAR